MRVRVRTLIACPLGTWQRGDVTADLPEAMARALVESGQADLLEAPGRPPATESPPPTESRGPEATALDLPSETTTRPRPRLRRPG